MIKMTNELFEKFSTKQEILDKAIREKHNISNIQWHGDLEVKHYIALRVEVAEFVNECHDVWKYWKQKSIVPDRLLDEAVDVIHFLHLIMNKHTDITNYSHISEINGEIKRLLDVASNEHYSTDMLLFAIIDLKDPYSIYALLLIILDHYSFTLDDIEQAYDKKNKENHTRQANNY